MSSTKQCVICEDQGENAKIRNHYGCENSCDACRHFFGSSVKEMTKFGHTFLGGRNADRHCYNNFGCEVKGKRPCTSCRFLKCIENQMNPELPLKNAAKEVLKTVPENQNLPLDYYTKELGRIYESNLNILLSAAHEARANSNIAPATFSDNIPMDPGNHTLNVSYPPQPNSFHDGYMPNVQETHYWNNQTNGNGYTEFEVPYGSSQVSISNNPPDYAVGNSSYMHTHPASNVHVHCDENTILHVHAGHYENTWPNYENTHGTLGPIAHSLPLLGSQSSGTWNQSGAISHFGQATPVTVGQSYPYYAPVQLVNHAGPSTHEIEQKTQNLHLDPTIQKDSEIKDTTRKGSNKRKNPPKDANKTAKRSISADPFNRLAIKHNTEELCRILNTFGMKMDTGYECDYGNNPPDKRCECDRSLGLPGINPVTQKKTLQNTMMDGPHHFANWMCHNCLHPDIFALENPKKVLTQKSICPAGRFYQSRDLMGYCVAESAKEGGKYVELEKSELRSGVNYFICCKRKEQQYWQIYYGTDERCVAGYGPYSNYDERKYFFNKEFHQ